MPEENGNSNVEIKTGFGSVALNSKRMAEIISVMLVCAVGILGYVVWDHSHDSRTAAVEFKIFLNEIARQNREALKESADANQNIIKQLVDTQQTANEVQRETNCLISLPQEERRKEFLGENSFCKRMARRY